jgi:uncharacterized membrane protein
LWLVVVAVAVAVAIAIPVAVVAVAIAEASHLSLAFAEHCVVRLSISVLFTPVPAVPFFLLSSFFSVQRLAA